MGFVKLSIEIAALAEDVFSLVKDEKKMLSLVPLPLKWEFHVEKLTDGPVRVGTKYRVSARRGKLRRVLWTAEVVGLVENRLYHTKSTSGFNFKVSKWTLEPISVGTRLTRTLEYDLPGWILGTVADWLWVNKKIKKKTEEWLMNIKRYMERNPSAYSAF
ncbi:SRPBCC family protein [Candidatus Hecatella orcuttiae]|jgi:uncharacterized membrane protein|uniref:SRPBCC family protein n=1 Tax=Candidatus Hecatella orcuttiae TaxID=1935119 RepID=UPI002867E46A|nr:SRPBCC family protein [Candidatus Hecatella orcuttiae]